MELVVLMDGENGGVDWPDFVEDRAEGRAVFRFVCVGAEGEELKQGWRRRRMLVLRRITGSGGLSCRVRSEVRDGKRTRIRVIGEEGPGAVAMPNKLQKALGAVKDQTSISFARVTGTRHSNLDVAILKATTHEEEPVEDSLVSEVVLLVAASRANAAGCVRYIGRRIERTRNWIVALKSLTLIFRLLQDGDPDFAQELHRGMKRGSRLLNLSNFRDDSAARPWDFTAFVRTYALYLRERLECALLGKLRRRPRARDRHHPPPRLRRRRSLDGTHDMKPAVLLDKILYWQKLLDRVLGTRPTGLARNNHLVLTSLHALLRESFDLYRDVADALALVLDNFFHLPRHSSALAYRAYCAASKQFDELAAFYAVCQTLGIGRSSEYPAVQKISTQLLETLRQFLNDDRRCDQPPSSTVLPLSTATVIVVNQTQQPDSHCFSPHNEHTVTDLDCKSTLPFEDESGGSAQSPSPDSGGLIDLSDSGANDRESESESESASELQHRDCFDLAPNESSALYSSSPPDDDDGHDHPAWETMLVESAANLADKLNSINQRLIDLSLHDSVSGASDLPAHSHSHHHNNPFLETEAAPDEGFFQHAGSDPLLFSNHPYHLPEPDSVTHS